MMYQQSPAPTEQSDREKQRMVWIGSLVLGCGLLISILAFFPGWMSADSLVQYADAKAGLYHDWHPVLMAWWWRQLNKIYVGPAPMLLQSVLLYWGAFALVLAGACRTLRIWALPLAFVGFWPGILFPLGQIWKDIVFATLILFCIALVFFGSGKRISFSWFLHASLVFCLVLAVGVKPNGAVVLPIVVFYALYVQFPHWPFRRRALLCAACSIAIVLVSWSIVPARKIIRCHGFQYTEVHDLLAISAQEHRILLPPYVTKKVPLTVSDLARFYSPASDDLLFWQTPGTLVTTNQKDYAELDRLWEQAVLHEPIVYLTHRARLSAALLRLGSPYDKQAGAVAFARTDPNPYGFLFQPNAFSDRLKQTTERHAWMYFPDLYCALLLVELACLGLYGRALTPLSLTLNLSAWAFLLPHFFLAPAGDVYRYLYFVVLCAVANTGLFVSVLGVKVSEKFSRGFTAQRWRVILAGEPSRHDPALSVHRAQEGE